LPVQRGNLSILIKIQIYCVLITFRHDEYQLIIIFAIVNLIQIELILPAWLPNVCRMSTNQYFYAAIRALKLFAAIKKDDDKL
jgi:hypothetical protein